jgi:peptidyl-prolyl cis-trans isomerase A (cyclophilin A)
MKMKIKIIALLFLGMLNLQAQNKKTTDAKKPAKTAAAKKATTAPAADGLFAEFQTNKGKILVRLEYQKTPITVANFVSLAEGKNTFVTDEKLKGKPYYDGLKFHRVIKDFMIQGGDPAGNGSGGSGYSFKDEIVPEFVFDKPGILAMANSGPATNSSQFFITHKETAWLNGKHTIFGYVVSGQDVVNTIAQEDLIQKVTIIRKGASAKAFDAAKVFSDYMTNVKPADDKKMNEDRAKEAATREEARVKQAAIDAENKKVYDEKYAPVKAAKVKDLTMVRAKTTKSATGLQSIVLKPGNGKKPADGSTMYIHYAGYLEDGSLFDSSYEEVAKAYGKFDENRQKQGGYNAFPFQAGKKDGLIPGFIEGISDMTFGEKKMLFIPSSLAYGERGAGNVIPPNANIIFEVEIFETQPNAPAAAVTPKQ